MRDALVFNGASNLDFQEIRSNVIRIPEVVARVRAAQAILDKISPTPLDLANFIGSEDAVFLGHLKLKNFSTAIVQVGLLDRYLKNHPLPQFVVGMVNGDSPLLVALGKLDFTELVASSAALARSAGKPVVQASGSFELPILTGVQLADYGVYSREPSGEYERMGGDTREVEKMIVNLVDQYDVCKLVMVGPGSLIFGKKILDLTGRDVQVLETIDLDPMLSWFWAKARESRMAVAN